MCGVKGPDCGSSSALTVVELVTATPDDGGVDGNRKGVDNGGQLEDVVVRTNYRKAHCEESDDGSD